VRTLREQRNVTQVELADAATVSTQHLSAIERGLRNATIQVAARIARALGIPLSDLIFRAERGR
jgi:transcriptional regulator with XRE-family HTH domain